MQVFFVFQGREVPAKNQPLFATTYMRGNAAKWIKPYVLTYLTNDATDEDLPGIKEWMESFTKFKIEIKKILGPSNEDKVATQVI
jgi:hypothetical protein